jgi:Ran GTPase-activating protein (RanGAP) involved in mRNA processing and transport
MEGASKMCESFACCATLRHVDLSFNALGKEGGAALGKSLMSMPVCSII